MVSKVVIADNQSEVRLSKLGTYEIIDLNDYPNGYDFEPGVRYLVIGKKAYDLITGEPNHIHLGLRKREFFHEATQCPYLVTRNGFIFKFIYLDYSNEINWLSKEDHERFERNIDKLRLRIKDATLKTGISKKNGKPWYRLDYKTVRISNEVNNFMIDEQYLKNVPKMVGYKIIREIPDIINSLNYFTELPVGTFIGLDYETHGKNGNAIPFESPYFDWMGVSLATCDGIAAYYDIEYYERAGNEEIFRVFKEYYKRFLDKHGDYCITYNVSFELRCTYLLLHKMYMFQDAATINKIEGNNSRNYSLKFTAQKYIPGIGSWDDDFDILQDKFWPMFSESTPETYHQHPNWIWITQNYKEEIPEFELLISKYWGDPFGCIPANILGKYCCKDSFHTVLIRKAATDLGYSDKCWTTFDANMRMHAWLDINGAFIDLKIQKEYSQRCWWTIAYSKLVVAKYYLTIKLEDLSNQEFPDIPYLINILKAGVNPYDGKSLMTHYYTESDPSGFNMELMTSELGLNHSMQLVSTWTKYYPILDINAVGKARKVYNEIQYLVNSIWNKENIIINDKVIGCRITYNGVTYEMPDLSLVINYYKMKSKLSLVNDYLSHMSIYDPHEYLEYDDKKLLAKDLSFWVDNNVINIQSPDTKYGLVNQLLSRYHPVIFDRYEHPDKIYDHLVNGGFEEHYDWDYDTMHLQDKIWYGRENANCIKGLPLLLEALNDPEVNQELTPDEILGFKLDIEKVSNNYVPALVYLNNRDLINKIKWVMKDDKGREIPNPKYHIRTDGFEKPVNPKNFKNAITGSISPGGSLNATLFKSFGCNAMFSDKQTKDYFLDHFDDIDPSEVSLRGLAKFSVCYAMARKYFKSVGTYLEGMLVDHYRFTNDYDDNNVITEKWNHPEKLGDIAHIYTSFNCMEKKSGRWSAAFHTIPGHGAGSCVKRVVTAPPGHLISYFDISGAEVRAIAYLSKDKFMLKNYTTPRNANDYQNKGPEDPEIWRTKGLDPYIEAARVLKPGLDESEYKKLRGTYKTSLLGKLYGMGDESLAGRIGGSSDEASEASEKLFELLSDIDDYIKKAGDYVFEHHGDVFMPLGNKINILSEPQDRWSRLGINLRIQGTAAVTLAEGFEHNIQMSWRTNEVKVRPINVVHDSSQNILNADSLFRIQDFYERNMQGYLYHTHGINYAFDTLIGKNYYDMCEMRTIEYDKIIELKGSRYAIDQILSELDYIKENYQIDSLVSKKGVNCLNPDGSINYNEYKIKSPHSLLEGFIYNYEAYQFEDTSEYVIRIIKL